MKIIIIIIYVDLTYVDFIIYIDELVDEHVMCKRALYVYTMHVSDTSSIEINTHKY